MPLNSLVVKGMTEPLNNRGQGVAFYHPKRDGCTVVMISKGSVAARWRSHLQKATKGLVHISEGTCSH